jgi:hypothetical protein
VRWVHSLVTSRMPRTGSRNPCGVAVTPMKLMKVRSDWFAVRKKMPMISSVMTPMAISSHFPARVSASLRSSTRTSRDIGMRGVPEMSSIAGPVGPVGPVGWVGSKAVAVMRGPLPGWRRAGCRR